MSFQQATGLALFNSAASCEFLNAYQDHLKASLQSVEGVVKAPAFAPSSFACERYSWFRLRGVKTDGGKQLDPVLDFQAELGTAVHRRLQRHLKEMFGKDYIDPATYLASKPRSFEFTSEPDPDSMETRIQVIDPPMRMAVDAIIKWKEFDWLIEIKSCDYGKWNEMTDPREKDKDQICCYSAVFGLSHVLVLYVDRLYGGVKAYELNIPDYKRQEIWDTIARVQEAVVNVIAPPKLASGGWKCSECIYSKKCKAW